MLPDHPRPAITPAFIRLTGDTRVKWLLQRCFHASRNAFENLTSSPQCWFLSMVHCCPTDHTWFSCSRSTSLPLLVNIASMTETSHIGPLGFPKSSS